MSRVGKSLLICAVALLFGGCMASAPTHAVKPPALVFSHEWLGDIDKAAFAEPSGIVYHPARSTLFVVGDDGDICEIETDGAVLKVAEEHSGLEWRDYEGITCDPSTGLLYVIVEGEEKILEVDPETFETTREFALERSFEGSVVMAESGQGIEGIAFVPDASHAEGGTFFITNQNFILTEEHDVSAVFEVEVPLKSTDAAEAKAVILRCFSLGVVDLSGMCYDAASERLYIISDSSNTLWEVSRQGRILSGWALPGNDQEGITLDPDGRIYIAQDSGGIIKMRWLRD